MTCSHGLPRDALTRVRVQRRADKSATSTHSLQSSVPEREQAFRPVSGNGTSAVPDNDGGKPADATVRDYWVLVDPGNTCRAVRGRVVPLLTWTGSPGTERLGQSGQRLGAAGLWPTPKWTARSTAMSGRRRSSVTRLVPCVGQVSVVVGRWLRGSPVALGRLKLLGSDPMMSDVTSGRDAVALRGLDNLVAPMAVTLVLLGSTLFAVTGIRASEQQHAIAHGAPSVRAELNHLAALENGAEAGEDAPAEEIDEALDALDLHLKLALEELPSEESTVVRETVDRFAAAAAFTARAYSIGEIDEADAVDDEEADPLFDSLTLEFKGIEERATQRAIQSASNAIRGLVVSSVAAGLVIVGVIVVEGRSAQSVLAA